MLCNQKLTTPRVAITTCWKLLSTDVSFFYNPPVYNLRIILTVIRDLWVSSKEGERLVTKYKSRSRDLF